MTTKNTEINKSDGWVETETTGSGNLSASKAIEFCKATSQPDEALSGHHLKTMDTNYIVLETGEALYTRTDETADVIVITTFG